jgi:hypothetical protein
MKIQYFFAILILGVMVAVMAGCGSGEGDASATLPYRETTADPSKPADKTNAAAQGTPAPQ